ncbi:pantoate--beta-alanine ligase [Vibrio sp. IB15]|jgi:pantoate--beta-alanine ligase|uniref:Pantothenate synthetase n=1 Tax=Vibrio chagasii TaxID=170679 RepID=A0A2S7VIG9_9VIBR|nr:MULTISPECIES: pantoate--beta-alanine ligase [Vibrio]EDK27026.1 pantoate--beta-alanine ligase [Vibrionales bacterium SWAT-3]MDE9379298.1 pantoate--beta-alanine ligase [Vibrio alginolyticus]MEC7942096.1 pantoate--beta-alanine ligase [Pseudomonadota bacterium]EGU44117.1 pantoate--beta-alanine ligase [Vibrio splendidus ATCC 33789]KZX62557.1 pantoate--beta-alanine ligase [Vibrio sp. HI00D65]|tara:strand:+ start:334 stop:1224 length:891 start_codon:yes stop_codon:yes gene_type:complete|eukprot:TRINITY_DN636_c1_g1_i2.p5 TRINITY_DN636_c1_g1~~TRINITY_DN636_c1_g1_i2.p5  ORF type:complete len:297 (+),score=20.00 TRINITY_DN636_c1_g1_i2:6508-7398(+)
MQTFAEIAALREQIKQFKRDGRTVAFVPTMGNLHEGHLTLVKKARELADIVVVSIFVNPMQFDRADDLNNYPRTLEADLSKLTGEGVELVFTPTPEVMYPDGLDKQTFVEVPGLSHMLEGASRPGHFRGVATIVTKLFNIVQPDFACFGEKDFQQLAVIRQMTTDLALDIEIVGVATVREMDGLAMSSRNSNLTIDERQRAPVLARTMRWISSAIRGGRDDYASVIEDATDQLRAADLQPDEIFICDAKTLQAITSESTQAVILMSAFLGKTRLIDNQVLDLVTETKEEVKEETAE